MFYDRLKSICEERGISLRSLSIEIGIGKSTMGAWRDGAAPSSTFLLKLSDYFNVSCDWFLERTNDPSPPDSNNTCRVLSEDEIYYIEKLRKCDISMQHRIMICGLVMMGCIPDRDQLPSLRSGQLIGGMPVKKNNDDDESSVS